MYIGHNSVKKPSLDQLQKAFGSWTAPRQSPWSESQGDFNLVAIKLIRRVVVDFPITRVHFTEEDKMTTTA